MKRYILRFKVTDVNYKIHNIVVSIKYFIGKFQFK
jgi:hypothetical protein